MTAMGGRTRALALLTVLTTVALHQSPAVASTTLATPAKTAVSSAPAATAQPVAGPAAAPVARKPKRRRGNPLLVTRPPAPSRTMSANLAAAASALRPTTPPVPVPLISHAHRLPLRSLGKGKIALHRPHGWRRRARTTKHARAARTQPNARAGIYGTPCSTGVTSGWATGEACVDANHRMVVVGGNGQNSQFSIYYGGLDINGAYSGIDWIEVLDYGDGDIIPDAPCIQGQESSGQQYSNWVACPINLAGAWNANSIAVYANDGDDDISTTFDSVDLQPFTYPLSEYGGPGHDTLHASPAEGTTLSGDDDPDNLYGGPYGDTLFGGGGDDYIKPGGGNDTISGGAGWDTLDYYNDPHYPNVTVSPDNQPNDPGRSNVWNDTELISGTSGNDVFIGGNGANESYEFHANGGRDTFFSGPDPDTFKGTGGAPDLTGTGAADIVSYAPTPNYGNLFPGGVSAQLNGYGPGGDFLDANIDVIRGTATTDTLTGDGGPNLLIGSGATDYLSGGGGGGDLLYGDAGPGASLPAGEVAGNDVFYAEADGDTFHGGGGNDIVTYERFSTGVTANLGHVATQGQAATQGQGPGGDRIAADITSLGGSQGADTLKDSNDGRAENLYGFGGDDTFAIGSASGVISVDGNSGTNTVDYSGFNQNQGVHVSPTASDSDRLTNVQRVVGTQYVDEFDGVGNGMTYIGMGANDTFKASSAGTDAFYGDALPYAITGIGPAGTIVGPSGDHDIADYSMRCGVHITIGGSDVDGTLGNDVEEVDGSGCADVIYGNGNTNWIHGGDGDDELHGGGGNDFLYGEDGSDHLFGDDGDDQLRGGNSDDLLYGGAGADRMWWEPGKDLYDPGDGSTQVAHWDVIDYSLASSAIRVQVDGTCSSGTANDHDCIDQGGYGNLVAFIGSNFDDTFKGSGGREWFIGGGGNDSFWGEGGADWFTGDCDGIIYGCNPTFPYGNHDAVHYDDQTADLTVKIDGNADSGVGGPAEGDLISTDVEDVWGGSGNDVIAGNTTSVGSQDNTLVGGPGNDHLYGYGGKDILDGGLGDDWLYGANGQQYGTAGESDTLFGGLGNDHLYGEDGRDILFGGLGDDTLVGSDVNGLDDGARDVLDARDGMPSVKGAHVKADGTADPSEDYEPDTHFLDTVRCTGTGGNQDEWFGDPTDTATGCDRSLLQYIGIPISVGGLGILEFHPFPVAPSASGVSGLTSFAFSVYDELFTRDGTLQDNLINLLRNSAVIALPDELLTWYAADRMIETLSVDPHTAESLVEYIDLAGPINIAEEMLDKCHYGDTHYIVFCRPPSEGVEVSERNGDDEVRVLNAPKTHVSLGAGNDTLMHDGNSPVGADGGTGNNSLIVSGTAGSHTRILSGIDDTPGLSGLTTKNFSTFTGGDEDDEFVGTTASETFDGGGGTNSLSYADHTASQGVTVTVPGTSGKTIDNGIPGVEHDTLSNIQSVIGGAGNDVINGSSGDDTIAGGGGNDTLDGKAGNNTLSFADKSASQPVVMTLSSAPNSTASVPAGGGAPGENVTYSNFVNMIGGGGNDQLTGDNRNNLIWGGPGDDSLKGGDGNDWLLGDDGNDTLDGQGGSDLMYGANGNDTITYASRASAVKVTVGVNADDGETINGVSEGDFVASSPGFDTIVGTNFADSLTGDASAQHFVGGGGDDTMDGGDGADVFDGGDGYDKVVYNTATGVNVMINGTSHGGPSEGDQIHTDVEEVDGGTGNDTFTGTTATQKFDGGAGIDTMTYMDRATPVKVTLGDTDAGSSDNGSFDATTGASTERDVLVHIENVIGGWGNDQINGNSGPNRLQGGPGDDVLHGGAGNDTLIPDSGNDTFYGDGGTDTVSFDGFPWNVTAKIPDSGLSTNNGIYGQNDKIDSTVENLVGGAQNDWLEGNKYSNNLDGRDGNDTVVGNGGLDFLNGGNGNDKVYGDAGPDKITDSSGAHVLASGTASPDFIYGGPGNDTIDAVDGGVDAISCGGDAGDVALIDAYDDPTDCPTTTVVGWGRATAVPGVTNVKGAAMTSAAPGRTDLVWVTPTSAGATTGTLMYMYANGTTWNSPIPVMYNVALRAPGIAPGPNNTVAVSYVGTDGNAYLIKFGCTATGGCGVALPRKLNAPYNEPWAGPVGIAQIANSTDTYVLFGEGSTDHKLWFSMVTPTYQQPWTAAQAGAPLLSAVPVDITLGPSTIAGTNTAVPQRDVFVVGSDGNMWDGSLLCVSTGCQFYAWQSLGRPDGTTKLLHGTAVAYDGGTIRVFARDASGFMQERTHTDLFGWAPTWTRVRAGSNPAVPMIATAIGIGKFEAGLVDSSNNLQVLSYNARPAGT